MFLASRSIRFNQDCDLPGLIIVLLCKNIEKTTDGSKNAKSNSNSLLLYYVTLNHDERDELLFHHNFTHSFSCVNYYMTKCPTAIEAELKK